MPSQMLETLLSALNAIQAMPFECPASMKAEVSKVLGDLPSAAQDQMKTGSPLTIKALAGLEGERLAKLVHRTVSLLSRSLVYDRDNGYSSGYSDSYNYSYSDQYTEDTGRKLPARGSSSERKSRGSSGEKSLPSGAVARMDAERVEVLARALEETVRGLRALRAEAAKALSVKILELLPPNTRKELLATEGRLVARAPLAALTPAQELELSRLLMVAHERMPKAATVAANGGGGGDGAPDEVSAALCEALSALHADEGARPIDGAAEVLDQLPANLAARLREGSADLTPHDMWALPAKRHARLLRASTTTLAAAGRNAAKMHGEMVSLLTEALAALTRLPFAIPSELSAELEALTSDLPDRVNDALSGLPAAADTPATAEARAASLSAAERAMQALPLAELPRLVRSTASLCWRLPAASAHGADQLRINRLLSEVTLQLEGLQQSQGGVKSAALQAAVNEVLSSCPPKLAQLSVARRAELLWKALKVYALVTGLQPEGVDDAHHNGLLGGASPNGHGAPREAWAGQAATAAYAAERRAAEPEMDDLGLGWLAMCTWREKPPERTSARAWPEHFPEDAPTPRNSAAEAPMRAPAAAAGRPAQRRALVVGIDYAGSAQQLDGCAARAQDMAAMLSQRGFHVVSLLDVNGRGGTGDAAVHVVPTTRRILQELVALAQWAAVSEGRQAWVHLIGSGANAAAGAGGAALMPSDWNERGAISNDVLASIVRTFPGHSSLLVVLDTVHAGFLPNVPFGAGGRVAKSARFAKTVPAASHVHVLASCAAVGEPSDAFGAGQQGKWAAALTAALLAAPRPQQSWGQLLEDVRALLRRRGATVTPVLSSSSPLDLAEPVPFLAPGAAAPKR